MACLLVVAVGALVYNNKVIQPRNHYNAAQELLECKWPLSAAIRVAIPGQSGP
jgi:hypothetical protein